MTHTLIVWFSRSVMFGMIMLFGATGEILTEKSGHLNLGVPGLMYLGGFSSFAATYIYEMNAGEAFNPAICIILALSAGFFAAFLGGLLYSFLTITLRANQNVSGLALTIFGVGIGNFFGVRLMNGQTTIAATRTFELFSKKPPFLSDIPVIGEMFFGYGFLAYVAVIIAVIAHLFLKKTRVGLNLRSIGENPATADAAGINISLYKYLATTIGAGICGLGGVYYIMEYNKGMWATENGIEALGWLAVALVIFANWKPAHAIWGGVMFGVFSWAYAYISNFGLIVPNWGQDLIKALPYVMTIIVLTIASIRQKKENKGPASLGLSYFREDR